MVNFPSYYCHKGSIDLICFTYWGQMLKLTFHGLRHKSVRLSTILVPYNNRSSSHLWADIWLTKWTSIWRELSLISMDHKSGLKAPFSWWPFSFCLWAFIAHGGFTSGTNVPAKSQLELPEAVIWSVSHLNSKHSSFWPFGIPHRFWSHCVQFPNVEILLCYVWCIVQYILITSILLWYITVEHGLVTLFSLIPYLCLYIQVTIIASAETWRNVR